MGTRRRDESGRPTGRHSSDVGAATGSRPCRARCGWRGQSRGMSVPRTCPDDSSWGKGGTPEGGQGPEALGHGTPLWQPPRQPCARSSSTYEVIEIHKYYAQIGSEFTLVNDSPGGQQFLPTPPCVRRGALGDGESHESGLVEQTTVAAGRPPGSGQHPEKSIAPRPADDSRVRSTGA